MATVAETIHEDESERHDRAILPKFPTPAHSRSPARRASNSTTTVETTPGSGNGGNLKDKLARAMSPRRGSQTTIDGISFGSECPVDLLAEVPRCSQRASTHKPCFFLYPICHSMQQCNRAIAPFDDSCLILITTGHQPAHMKRRPVTLLERDWLETAYRYLHTA